MGYGVKRAIPHGLFGSSQHLAVCTKGVECGRQQVVGFRYPVSLTGNDLAVAVYIVVIAVNLNQASIGLGAVHIVI